MTQDEIQIEEFKSLAEEMLANVEAEKAMRSQRLEANITQLGELQ